MKKCSRCKQFKDFVEFGSNKATKDKLNCYCKICMKGITKKWRLKNLDKVKMMNKKQYNKNIHKNREYAKNYKKLHKNQINERVLRKRSSDPIYYVSDCVRRLINQAIDKRRFNGSTRYLEYSIKDLVNHLESKFKKEMSWNNKGKKGWHIDHIIPLKYKREDGSYYWNQEELINPNSNAFKKAWSLSNLQPLWEFDNCSKGNRTI